VLGRGSRPRRRLRLVHDSAEAEPIAGRRAARAAAGIAVALAVGLTACGTDDREEPGALGGPTLDAPVEHANCTDWEDGSVDERLGTIAQIENFVGGPVGNDGGTGAVLDSEKAYDVMESFCGETYARGFRLYKLYTRAAAFTTPQ
jgi:hypothetical protein